MRVPLHAEAIAITIAVVLIVIGVLVAYLKRK